MKLLLTLSLFGILLGVALGLTTANAASGPFTPTIEADSVTTELFRVRLELIIEQVRLGTAMLAVSKDEPIYIRAKASFDRGDALLARINNMLYLKAAKSLVDPDTDGNVWFHIKNRKQGEPAYYRFIMRGGDALPPSLRVSAEEYGSMN